MSSCDFAETFYINIKIIYSHSVIITYFILFYSWKSCYCGHNKRQFLLNKAGGNTLKKKCQTKLIPNKNNKEVFVLIQRAINWLNTNSYNTKIVKWETKNWGEIPADFGRK